jgi:hypothetical protein
MEFVKKITNPGKASKNDGFGLILLPAGQADDSQNTAFCW